MFSRCNTVGILENLSGLEEINKIEHIGNISKKFNQINKINQNFTSRFNLIQTTKNQIQKEQTFNGNKLMIYNEINNN